MRHTHSPFPEINLEEYQYNLPKEKIAQYPITQRDQSKLIQFKDGEITHHTFRDIADLIPKGATLFFNDTKVIPARIILQRITGARIEVFLLEPVFPSKEMAQAMLAKNTCSWKCLVGNLKKWKDDEFLDYLITSKTRNIKVKISLESRSDMIVRFSWNDQAITFSEILEELGKIPLPPYVNRESETSDIRRYQTVYSKSEGAVAAPTAGLHFTKEVMDKLNKKGINTDFLTLHVSAGTFQPVKVQNIAEHPMHSEQVLVSRKNIESMLDSKFSIAVGTTSMRTLESIYWYGVQLENTGDMEFYIRKNAPYLSSGTVPLHKSLSNILSVFSKLGSDHIIGNTEIFIVPGYEFQSCKGLVTNFHMPRSTLILLVAAFIGSNWKKVYTEALYNSYRFLSYGDSSLLFSK